MNWQPVARASTRCTLLSILKNVADGTLHTSSNYDATDW